MVDSIILALARRTSQNEAGTIDLRKASSQIANDTSNSKSYGFMGLNSLSGNAAHSFTKIYGKQLGLQGAVGSPEFDASWKRAAQNNSDALVAAQLDYYQKNIIKPAKDILNRSGINNLSSDPAVISYISDMVVQYGQGGTEHHVKRALKGGVGSGDASGFLKGLTNNLVANMDRDFVTHLSQNPQNKKGLINRATKRYSQAIGGDLNVSAMGGTSYDFSNVGVDESNNSRETIPIFSAEIQEQSQTNSQQQNSNDPVRGIFKGLEVFAQSMIDIETRRGSNQRYFSGSVSDTLLQHGQNMKALSSTGDNDIRFNLT